MELFESGLTDNLFYSLTKLYLKSKLKIRNRCLQTIRKTQY